MNKEFDLKLKIEIEGDYVRVEIKLNGKAFRTEAPAESLQLNERGKVELLIKSLIGAVVTKMYAL